MGDSVWRYRCPAAGCTKTYASTSKLRSHIVKHVNAGELPQQPVNNRNEFLYASYRYAAGNAATAVGQAEDRDHPAKRTCHPARAAQWQEADTAALLESDKAQRDFVDAGFRAAGLQWASQVNADTAKANAPPTNTTFNPAATANSLLAAHIHDLPGDAALQQHVLPLYQELLQYAQPAVTTFQVLEHPSDVVADVMQAVRQAGDTLVRDGAILVRSGSSSFIQQRKLAQFLQHGDQIKAWPGEEELGDGGLWHSQDGKEAGASVHQMSAWGHGLQAAIISLARGWGLGDISNTPLQLFCFMAALLRCLPRSLSTLYEQELDIMTDRAHTTLLHGREATLLDTETARLPVVGTHLDVDEPDLYVDIECRRDASLSNSQAASAWSLSDDATGPLLNDMFAENSSAAPVRVALGIQIAVVILSLAYTYTPAHIEDLLLGAVNMLLYGAWKVWFIVPPACSGKFKAVLLRKYGPGALARLLAKRLRPDLSAAEMAEAGVRLLFQPPGYMVVTPPGEVFHWTISLGFSVAEAANCFIQLPGGPTLQETVQLWEGHVKEAAVDRQAFALANPKQAKQLKPSWDSRMQNSSKVKDFMGL